ncbi:MAG: hypothetical protein RL338_1085 [Chloroflexota bacterium]
MEIGLVGVGYIGLVTAACLAHLGHDVRCHDADELRVAALADGVVPFREPGLDELVATGRDTGRLTFHHDLAALRGAELVVVAVGTLDAAGEWTAEHVRSVILALAADPLAPRAVVIRSTLVPGTARALAAEARSIDPAMSVALCPEFTREGTAIEDFLKPDRIVVGLDVPATAAPIESRVDAAAGALLGSARRLFDGLVAPLHVTDLTSAELIKMGSNVLLATKISYANEIARLAHALGGDPRSVVDGIGLDARIGRAFLTPGPGYGGSCLPSQARILPAAADLAGADVPVIAAVARSNETQMDWVIDRAETHGVPLRGANVAILGLTFKARTDDLRESPALRIAELIAARGACVTVHDPAAGETGHARLRAAGVDADLAPSAAAACRDADVVFVLTEWDEYRSLDWAAIAPTMRGRLVVDARWVVDGPAAVAAGLDVVGVAASRLRGDRAPSPAASGRTEPLAQVARDRAVPAPSLT